MKRVKEFWLNFNTTYGEKGLFYFHQGGIIEWEIVTDLFKVDPIEKVVTAYLSHLLTDLQKNPLKREKGYHAVHVVYTVTWFFILAPYTVTILTQGKDDIILI